MTKDRELTNPLNEQMLAEKAMEINWPDVTREDAQYEVRVAFLIGSCERLGRETFELYYNLRSPNSRIERFNRDAFQSNWSEDETRTRFEADAKRDADIEMLEEYHKWVAYLLEQYSKLKQEIHDYSRQRDDFGESEKNVDRLLLGIRVMSQMWKENMLTLMEFLEELRVGNGTGLLSVGEFEGTTAHWIAIQVVNRAAEAWESCRDISDRSHNDPSYLYAATASSLFMETWFSKLPEPQRLLERIREEYVMARLALKRRGTHQEGSVRGSGTVDPDSKPTTFISYSWDSDTHKTWVRDLAKRLRENGVATRIDQWEAVPGDQLPHFMEKSIRDCDKVIIICTPAYKERADARIGGVGYEGDIMTAELTRDRNHRKFIPVLRLGRWESALPTWLQGKMGIDFRQEPIVDTEFTRLLRALLNKNVSPPPLGKTPDLPAYE